MSQLRGLVSRLEELVAQCGVDVTFERRRIDTDADARRERFLGSPTLRVDGVDVEPGAGDRSDYGMKCRLYPSADGLRGAPPDAWVLAAFGRAADPTSAAIAAEESRA